MGRAFESFQENGGEACAWSSADGMGLYISLPEAREEISRRWNNSWLKSEVELFLEESASSFFLNGPKAILARSIASPNNEAIIFKNNAKKIGVKPLFVEYTSDKFVTSNSEKYHLAKLFFQEGIGKKNGEKLKMKLIVDLHANNGKRICDVKTQWGERIVDFHHRMFQKAFSPEDLEIFDISEWILQNGSSAKKFYEKYLSLFVAHGVLFENFLVYNEKERIFTEDIVLPAIENVRRRFGVAPLITPLFSEEDDLPSDPGLRLTFYLRDLEEMVPIL